MNEAVKHSEESRRPRGLTVGSVVLLVIALLGVLALALTRRSAEARERRERNAAVEAGPTVRVAQVDVSPADRALTLPAEVRAWAQSTLYAKVAGYVREVRVDKGTPVKKGDLLARLESPETDQAVLGARADVQVKQIQVERLRKLRPRGSWRSRTWTPPRARTRWPRPPSRDSWPTGLRASAGAVRRRGDRSLRRPRRAGRGRHLVHPVGAADVRPGRHADDPGAGLRRARTLRRT